MRRSDCDLRDVLGVSQLMWGAGANLDAVDELDALFAGVPDVEAAAILSGNAARTYSLKLPVGV